MLDVDALDLVSCPSPVLAQLGLKPLLRGRLTGWPPSWSTIAAAPTLPTSISNVQFKVRNLKARSDIPTPPPSTTSLGTDHRQHLAYPQACGARMSLNVGDLHGWTLPSDRAELRHRQRPSFACLVHLCAVAMSRLESAMQGCLDASRASTSPTHLPAGSRPRDGAGQKDGHAGRVSAWR